MITLLFNTLATCKLLTFAPLFDSNAYTRISYQKYESTAKSFVVANVFKVLYHCLSTHMPRFKSHLTAFKRL
ncbi:hypothetical protein GCM10008915_79910 [Bifidobacterium pullorum subsp. gallinarum]